MKCLCLLIGVSLVSLSLASPVPARKLAVSGVDNDGIIIQTFGGGSCSQCASGPGLDSPCLGPWPPIPVPSDSRFANGPCTKTADGYETAPGSTCLSFCETGYGFWCPETCAAVNPVGFASTAWSNADYSKNNNDVLMSGFLSGFPDTFPAFNGLTCEEMEVVTDPVQAATLQLTLKTCATNMNSMDSIISSLCPASCKKMFDMETCAGTDSATFLDKQANQICAAWVGACSKQSGKVANAKDAYITNCAGHDTTTWIFDDPSHACEEGGYIGGTGKYFTKATMDDIRQNCPVSCFTCHDNVDTVDNVNNKDNKDDSSSSSDDASSAATQSDGSTAKDLSVESVASSATNQSSSDDLSASEGSSASSDGTATNAADKN